MDDREKLVDLIHKAKLSMWGKNGLSCELARNMHLAESLIAHGVTVQKHGRWMFRADGSGTCDQCGFTQKNVWDDDNHQNFCGICGAKMDEGE